MLSFVRQYTVRDESKSYPLWVKNKLYVVNTTLHFIYVFICLFYLFNNYMYLSICRWDRWLEKLVYSRTEWIIW